MITQLAMQLIDAKLKAAQGEPVTATFSIPKDGSVEQAKFLAIVERLSTGKQHPSGLVVRVNNPHVESFDDFLRALEELVGREIVDDVLRGMDVEHLRTKAPVLSPDWIERNVAPLIRVTL